MVNFWKFCILFISINLACKSEEGLGGYFGNLWSNLTSAEKVVARDQVRRGSQLYLDWVDASVKGNPQLTQADANRALINNKQAELKTVGANLNKEAENAVKEEEELRQKIYQKALDIGQNLKNRQLLDENGKKELEKLINARKEITPEMEKSGSGELLPNAWLSFKSFLQSAVDLVKKTGNDISKTYLESSIQDLKEDLVKLEENKTKRILNIVNNNQKLGGLEGELSLLLPKDKEMQFRRQTALQGLEGAIGRLVTSEYTSKNLAEMAFHQFKEIEADLKNEHLEIGDIKDAYKNKSELLANQFNNSPIGIYVNSQIAKAMGAVCDVVKNQCAGNGAFDQLFDFLDDSSRKSYIHSIDEDKSKKQSTEAK